MSSPTNPIQQDPPPSVVNPTATNPTTASAAVASNYNQAQANADSRVSSLEDLKKQSPELYDKMMMSLANSIMKKMREHTRKLKTAMREARRAGGGS